MLYKLNILCISLLLNFSFKQNFFSASSETMRYSLYIILELILCNGSKNSILVAMPPPIKCIHSYFKANCDIYKVNTE